MPWCRRVASAIRLYLKAHRAAYCESLQKVRIDGDWEQWIEFFLRGVAAVSESGVVTMRKLLALVEGDRRRIDGALGARKGLSALRVHDVFARRVVASISSASKMTGLTTPTVSSPIEALERLGVVREVTAQQRNRQFVYDGYLRALEEPGVHARP